MIRTATVFDAPLLAALQGRCFPEERWSAETFASLLGHAGTRGLIAASDSEAGSAKVPEPVGFALFRTIFSESEVITIGVLPEYQRSGFGRRLLDALVRAAIDDGAETVFLEVAEDNVAARRLYAEKGFVPVGFRPNYYSRKEGPVSALIQRLELRSAPGGA